MVVDRWMDGWTRGARVYTGLLLARGLSSLSMTSTCPQRRPMALRYSTHPFYIASHCGTALPVSFYNEHVAYACHITFG